MPDEPRRLLVEKHLDFIYALYKLPPDSLEAQVTQHIRINAIYWALIALHLLGRPDLLPRTEIIDFVQGCRHIEGGYGSSPGHDPHVVCTLHAIQILTLLDARDLLDRVTITRWIVSLQRPDGAIMGDKWGETDMRLTYAAIQSLSLLKTLPLPCPPPSSTTSSSAHSSWPSHSQSAQETTTAATTNDASLPRLDTEKVTQWVLSCRNFDGGFGMCPGAESHAAHAFTSLGTLSILYPPLAPSPSPSPASPGSRSLSAADASSPCQTSYTSSHLTALLGGTAAQDHAGWWLATRQLSCGGFNGRPEKKEDVCYSWWVLSSLSILGRQHWIDAAALRDFILSAQDTGTPSHTHGPGAWTGERQHDKKDRADGASQSGTTPDDRGTGGTGTGGGGISDRPGDVPDINHTCFGLAGLSLLGHEGLGQIDPRYCMPRHIIANLGL